MFPFFKTKRLSILVILAGLTYAFLVINAFVVGWDDFQTGFHDGAQTAKYNSNGKNSENKPLRSFYLSLLPKNGFSSFPDSLVNLKDNKVVRLKYRKMIVLEPNETNKSTIVYVLFKTIFAFIVTIALILIAVNFYRLIRSIRMEIIFDRGNIRLLNRIGFEMLIVYFGDVGFNYFHYKINCSIFNFSEYEIKIDPANDIWLLFGIVVLLAAEILSKALVLKEEQEFTI